MTIDLAEIDWDDANRVIQLALEEDLRYGLDATTLATVPEKAVATAEIKTQTPRNLRAADHRRRGLLRAVQQKNLRSVGRRQQAVKRVQSMDGVIQSCRTAQSELPGERQGPGLEARR